MRLKLYRAPGMAEAMARIRSELGADALILATKRTGGGVEVTAALQPEDEDALPVLRPPEEADPGRAARLAFHGVPPRLIARLREGEMAAALAGTLRFAPLPLGGSSQPILFAGPPGAGKTLTVARLATRLVIAGAAPMIVTADGRRAGAAEQLAAYTRLLGVSLIVASHPATLARAMLRRPEGVPVLIDAPGADAFDPAQRDEIAALAATADAAIALVLPAGLDPAEAADQAHGFAAAGASLLVATRLDAARRLGAVLAAAESGRLALAEAGIGPGAADGLVPLTPALLADRLLAPTQALPDAAR